MTPTVATTALLAMASVSLWTLRVALTAKNHKAMAAAAASVEATVFVLAFSRVLSSLDSVVQVAAYATGVGCGTLVGLTINDRLRPRTPSRLDQPVIPTATVTAVPVDEFVSVRSVVPTPECAEAPVTTSSNTGLVEDLRACIADWNNLEGRSLVTGGLRR